MASKNLAVMLSAMMLVRTVDQEDPSVLFQTRIAFGAYVLFTSIVYFLLHRRIISRNDRTKLKVKPPKSPLSPPNEEEPKEQEMTVLEYDMDLLRKARQGWIFNTILLTGIHYKMQTVSPLIMSGLMNFVKLITDDPLFKLHILGSPSVGKLKRPFEPEESPISAMLKGMLPKPEDLEGPKGENLRDDGDDTEDEDEVTSPMTIQDLPEASVSEDEEEDNEQVEEQKDDTETKKDK